MNDELLAVTLAGIAVCIVTFFLIAPLQEEKCIARGQSSLFSCSSPQTFLSPTADRILSTFRDKGTLNAAPYQRPLLPVAAEPPKLGVPLPYESPLSVSVPVKEAR